MEAFQKISSTLSRVIPRALSLLALLIALGAQPARAGGVVGTGTPGSCTEGALAAALAGGGLVTFDCGAAPHAIVLTTSKLIMDDTEIDGGGLITLSGGNAVPHFQVSFGDTLTLRNITLSRGSGTYGSIENFGTLNVINSQLVENEASATGGAIQNYGALFLTASTLADNIAEDGGGGLHNDGGQATLTNSEFISNTVNSGSGGGLWNNASLTITNSMITGNTLNGGHGGGIYTSGSLTMTEVLLEQNGAFGINNGGGIYQAAGTAWLDTATFRANRSTNGGGGYYVVTGTASVTQALFTGNEANFGAAITNLGTFTLTNSLIYSNTADNNIGGFYNAGSAATSLLVNVTVSENAPSTMSKASGVQSDGGSLEMIFGTIVDNYGNGIGRGSNANQLSIQNTIVAGNTLDDCMNSVASNGHNLTSDFSCSISETGDQTGTNPMLGSLANNGGPTKTYLPQPGSQAIDEGICVFSIDTDQRGYARFFGDACDIGAVEVGPPPMLLVFLPLLAH